MCTFAFTDLLRLLGSEAEFSCEDVIHIESLVRLRHRLSIAEELELKVLEQTVISLTVLNLLCRRSFLQKVARLLLRCQVVGLDCLAVTTILLQEVECEAALTAAVRGGGALRLLYRLHSTLENFTITDLCVTTATVTVRIIIFCTR